MEKGLTGNQLKIIAILSMALDHVICVLFTEECGGIFTIRFEEDGGIAMDTISEETDYLYDEVSAGLIMAEIQRKRQDLLEALSMYYRTFVLHMPIEEA